MILYKRHRGSLEESMATVREVENEDELIDIIRQEFAELGPVVKVEIKPYGYDPRIDWNVHLVMVTFQYDKTPYPVGMTNGKFD